MDDWDLYAVVRGCCNSSSTTTTTASTSITTTSASDLSCDFSWFPPLDLKQEQLYFPDLFNTRTPIEDLEQLCKPFLPPLNLSLPTSSSIPATQHQQQQQIQPPQLLRRSLASPNPSSSTPRPKRRKNQQKRVVCQVPAEGLSSDMWAWRKYGQKPIKGSPYPRGYYRCSSSKGCLARKQVERSRSDPSTFIITYTAEHNHPVPTHRNSLAGSTRNKSTTPKSTTTTTTTPTTTPNSQNHPCSSSSQTTGLSPTTPLSVSDELLQQSKEDGEEVEGMLDEEEDELSFPEDFFMELDELVGSTTTSSGGQFSASFPWIAAAGGS